MDTPPPTPQPNPFSVPEEIGGYQIQRVLGTGGMATVYAALQKQPRRTVALKVMKAGVAGDNTLRRFKREVEILGKLRHPYIAQVYAAGTHEDVSGATIPYFVMEYVPGAKTLLEFVSMHNLDIRERLKLFVKICAAVEHGHRAKVIHRDLKPGNILIDEAGEPKIIDFGVSHTTDMDITAAAGGQTMITEVGRLVGTLHYMSPEQVDTTRQDLDTRCDVYALGVILYKLTTGRFPVDVEAVPLYEAVRLIREKLPTRPSEVNPAVKGDLETIILKSLEKDRLRRYRNAGSLGRDIVRYLAGKPIHGRRAGLLYRSALFVRRHRAASIAAIVVLLTIAAACGFVLWNRVQMQRDAQRILAAREAQAKPDPRRAVIASQPGGGDEASVGAVLSVKAFVLAGHVGRINALEFAGPEAMLVSGGADGQVIVWNLAMQSNLHTVNVAGGAVMHLAISGDGRVIATAAADASIHIVDVASAKVLHSLAPACNEVTALAIDHTGSRVAFACDDLTLRLRDVSSDNTITLRGTTGVFTNCAFNADGNQLVAGSQRGAVYVWNVAIGAPAAPAQRLEGLNGEIVAVSFLAKDQRIAAVATDGKACVWPASAADQNATPSVFTASNSGLAFAAFSPNGGFLACVIGDKFSVWNLADPLAIQIGKSVPTEDTATSIAIDDAGQRVALGLLNGDIRVVPVK